MALRYVGGKTGAWVGSGTVTNSISLTSLTGGISSAAAVGDVVVAVYATGSTSDRTLAIGVGDYTLIAELYANFTYDTNLRVAYKVLTAADASVDFGPTGATGEAGTAAVHVWRGVDNGTPFDVAATTATGTNVLRPDPPAITPVTAGAVVLAAGGSAAQTGSLFSSNLYNFITATSADISDATVGIGSALWVSGSYNPVQWSGGVSTGEESWAAVTMVLRPAPSLTPSQLNNQQTFFTPTVTNSPAAQNLTASLLTNDQSFYAPFVDVFALRPQQLNNSQVFYAPTVASGAVSLAMPLIDPAATVLAPAVSAGSVSLLPVLMTGVQDFFLPTVLAGEGLLLPTSVINEQSFYTSSVVAGNVTVAPELLFNSQEFPNVLITGLVNVLPPLLNQSEQFYPANVKRKLAIRFGEVSAVAIVEVVDVLVDKSI